MFASHNHQPRKILPKCSRHLHLLRSRQEQIRRRENILLIGAAQLAPEFLPPRSRKVQILFALRICNDLEHEVAFPDRKYRVRVALGRWGAGPKLMHGEKGVRIRRHLQDAGGDHV